jgi:hypothetical protein
MLPTSSNTLDVLPRALVVYSHALMGSAIKSTLVRMGVEVSLSPISASVFSQEFSAHSYVFLVLTGQEDFIESQSLIEDLVQKLTAKTKLSIVLSLAQAGIKPASEQATSQPCHFDGNSIIKTFEGLHRNTSAKSIKTQLVLVQDVMDVSPSDMIVNPLQALISQIDENRINLVGSPELHYHPLSSMQAAEVIVRELFVLRQTQQIIGVRGREASTLLALAYEIKRVLVHRGVNTTQMVSLFPEHRLNSTIESLVYVTPTKALDLGDLLANIHTQPLPVSRVPVPQIKELPIPTTSLHHVANSPPPAVLPTPQPSFLSSRQTHKKMVTKPIKHAYSKPTPLSVRATALPKKRAKKTGLFMWFGTLLLLLALLGWMVSPFLWYALSSNNLLKANLETNPSPQALASLLRAQERVTNYLSVLSQITPAGVDTQLFNFNERFKQSTNKLVVQSHIQQFNSRLRELVAKQLNLVDGDVYQSATELAQIAQQNYQDLTTLELGSAATEGVINTQELQFSLDKIKSLKSSLKKMQLGLESLPYLFPPNQSSNVLVLIQNSHELRATGGFIESVGLLRFNSGKLISSEFKSSYELDQLLNGKVEPPEDLRKFLGENLWYGRDANWDPDFVNTAKNTAWFYEKQTNNSIDLVVAMSTPALGELLDSVDGVELADKTILDGSNLSSWLTESQKKLSGDQSTQPLLGPVVELLLKKMQSPDQVDLLSVAQALGDSLERSEMLVAGLKPESKTSLASLGWTGAVLSPVCPTVLSQAQCVVNTLYINETNVGVNSANAQVSRTQTHAISFKGDRITHTHQINFIHAGENEAWPGGVYQNYLRVYLPLNAGLLGVTQDGVKIADADIVQSQTQDKNIVGFLVRIPPNSSSQIVIEYDEINPITTQNALTYVFLMQKQPGITQAPLSLVLDYPSGYTLKRVSHPYALSDNHLMVNDTLAKHFFLAVELNP